MLTHPTNRRANKIAPPGRSGPTASVRTAESCKIPVAKGSEGPITQAFEWTRIKTSVQWARLIQSPITLTIVGVDFGIRIIASFLGDRMVDFMWRWGASVLDSDNGAQLWRLLVYAWIHADLQQLAWKAIYLLIAGSLLEPVIGSRKFAFIYCAGSLGATVPALILASFGSGESLIGASGAVSAILGAILVIPETSRLRRAVMFWLLAASSLACEAIGPQVPGVAYGAHFAGFIVGMFAGALIGLGVMRFGRPTRTPAAAPDEGPSGPVSERGTPVQ